MSNDDIQGRIERAYFLIDIKRPQQAIEELATIPQSDPEVAARVNCALVQAHLTLDQKEKAYACARRAIEAAPNHAMALYWLAHLEPDSRRALDHATRLVESSPELGPSHATKARALARNHRWEEALHAAREAENLDPEDSFVLNTLGRVLARDDEKAALEVFQRVLALEPENVAARESIASLEAGDHADASSRLYRDLLEENPAANVYENQLHWLVVKPLFTLCLGLSVAYLIGRSIAGPVYALGRRQGALLVGLAWTALFPLRAMGSAVRHPHSRVAAAHA